jgi:hypothetical protein
MAQQTFKEFLAKGLPFGDAVDHPFVYKALRDPDFPDANSWQEIESYIKGTNPDDDPEVLKAAQHLWQLYRQER